MSDITAIRDTISPAAFLATPVRIFGAAMVALHLGRQRAARYNALNDLSDAQLARRGLRRDQIVGHVFETITEA